MLNKTLKAVLALTFLSDPLLANVIGSELQNFNAAPSAEDLATVSSAKTLGQGRFSLGLFANAAGNSLPYFQDTENGNRDRRKKLNDVVTGLDFQASYGLTDRWDLSLAVPSIVDQHVKDRSDAHGEFSQTGVTELRLGSKYQLLTTEAFKLAAQGAINYNVSTDNPYTGNVLWPGASLELISTLQLGPVEWSVNFGHRWRDSKAEADLRAKLPIDPAGDQWLGSTGVAVDLPRTDIDLIGEVYTAYAEHVIADISTRKNSIVEGVLGIRKPLPYDLQFQAGIGSEITHSESSADYRIYLGLRWSPKVKTHKEEEVKIVPVAAPVAVASVGVLDRPADRVIELDEVYFKFDSTQFREAKAQLVLDQLKQALDARPIERVIIEGYTCSLGSDDYNLDLAGHRAEAIERILIQEYRVAPEKLVTVGWGKQHAKYDNSQEVTRMNNRRVTFRIFYQKELPSSSQNVAH